MNRQYIGARYVPTFANPIEWDKLRGYEAMTIVTYQGTSYTSKIPVPAGVELDDEKYWAVTGNYNAQVEQYRQTVESYKKEAIINFKYASEMLDYNLETGCVCRTINYANSDDNGGSYYVISSKVDSTVPHLTLSNGLYAIPVIENEINSDTFGITYDGKDNSDALNVLFTLSNTLHKTITFRHGTISTHSLTPLQEYICINGNGVTFNCLDSNKPAIDFRNVKNLYISDVNGNPYIYTESYQLGDVDRTLVLKNINQLGTGENIGYGLKINNPAPSNYDYSDGANNVVGYAKYGLDIENYSGYNALMIQNRNIKKDGTVTGAVDNSAIGIIDEVTGVAAPCILVETKRDVIRVGGDINNPAFDIASNGHVAIGCSNLSSDHNIPGTAGIKMNSDTPALALKRKGINNAIIHEIGVSDRDILYINSDKTAFQIFPNGYVVIPKYDNRDSSIIFSGTDDSSITPEVGKLVNLHNRGGKLRVDNYYTISDEDEALTVQVSSHGITNNRPSDLNSKGDVGYMFFDTTLNKPIWWNGSSWVDSTGTTV